MPGPVRRRGNRVWALAVVALIVLGAGCLVVLATVNPPLTPNIRAAFATSTALAGGPPPGLR